MNAPLDLAKELLELAREDLVAGEAILGVGAFRPVCFHAQQAVEKSLKAVLALGDVSYPWTHDLGMLINLLGDRMPALAGLHAALGELTEYGVGVRYSLAVAPCHDDASAALETARSVYALARREVLGDAPE